MGGTLARERGPTSQGGSGAGEPLVASAGPRGRRPGPCSG